MATSMARSAPARAENDARAPTLQPLAGRRIGFATSVVGFGGSEVLVADAIEAAVQAGAAAICYCHWDAAIRSILKERASVIERVTFRAWPPRSRRSPTREPAPSETTPAPHPWTIQSAYRRLAPLPLKRYMGFLAEVRRFCADLRQTSPDAMFVNVNGSEATAVASGMWNSSRTITCYHLSYTDPVGSWLDQWVDHVTRKQTIQAADVTVHTSQGACDVWCRRYDIPFERTKVIYNGVAGPPQVDRAALRAELGISPATFAFCVPGRLERVKGHSYLISALGLILPQLGDAVALICGDGPLRASLEAQCRELSLANQVRFLGFRRDLPAILAASDCTVLPSVESENLSVAVLESLMAGTPAVVTNVGGMAEAVQSGVTGLVVPPADAEALASALLLMVSDRERAAAMGQAACEDAQTRFARRRMMDEYVDLFSQVIAKASHVSRERA